MGCIFSRADVLQDSYIYETEMPGFSKVREPPVSRSYSVMSKGYFQQFVKRDDGHNAAYTEILE